MKQTLAQIIQRRAELSSEWATKHRTHQEWLGHYKKEIDDLTKREAMILGGIDLSRFDRGRDIIAIMGAVTKSNAGFDRNNGKVRENALEAAKLELSKGGGKLLKEYIGVKNYDRFGDQREDHSYGYGPRHGSIVFSIGLTRPTLERLRSGESLTEEETEDALYLLSALPTIEQARAAISRTEDS